MWTKTEPLPAFFKHTQSTADPGETEALGRVLARRLRSGDVVALRGGLGAGKTAFVRGMAAHLAPAAQVTSPTYALMNHYEGQIPLYHFDLYRLADEEELIAIGFLDLLDRGEGILAIEWSELAEPLLPAQTVRVTLDSPLPGGGLRDITIERGAAHDHSRH
ncbi:MAG: tRNA (adenosine(37)-N6)-threonylcarbamoyltransferase complex ATPase subunit type 1 TsaE [Clostridiales bacterium]|nr:tRNA (adenosine(37)-N6)-threonylcarbamoyltransferase complex ATPase subunit type 1 TsaE [Clostridiales bacterium]